MCVCVWGGGGVRTRDPESVCACVRFEASLGGRDQGGRPCNLHMSAAVPRNVDPYWSVPITQPV